MLRAMVSAVVVAVMLSAGLAGAERVSQATAQPARADGLILHEWGAWVRTSTDSGTMLSSPGELVKNLPSFVRLVRNKITPKWQDHGWDKPVIHLYGPDGLKVKVKIATPQGAPTAYFPSAALEKKTVRLIDKRAMMSSSLTDCFGIEWSGKLSAQSQGELPKVDSEHWWSRVRQVPSAYFHNNDSQERFLFYEATAYQEPVVVADISTDKMTLKLGPLTGPRNGRKTREMRMDPVGPVLVIINDGVKHWLRRLETIAAGQPVSLNKSDVLRQPATAQQILAAAQLQWQECGLTKEESSAIVQAWKPDLLGTFGFLVISRMPPPLYEKMFPLTVSPKPKEIVRVGMIFDTLPGCDGRLGWLPELKHIFEAWGKELGHAEARIRKVAAAKLMRQGDLARSVLEELAQNDSLLIKTEGRKLLRKLEPPKRERSRRPIAKPAILKIHP